MDYDIQQAVEILERTPRVLRGRLAGLSTARDGRFCYNSRNLGVGRRGDHEIRGASVREDPLNLISVRQVWARFFNRWSRLWHRFFNR